MIYFDNNATTHLDPVVAERMHALNLEGISNPASQHRCGRQALRILEQAKSDIIESVHGRTDSFQSHQVILTSGGTEANNLAIFGALAKKPGVCIVGGTDHPSVIEAANVAAEMFGGEQRVLPVDQEGTCDLEVLDEWLRSSTTEKPISLVSIMLGNNETGVLQDLKAICELCQKYDVPVHSDVVQAVGKVPVSIDDLGLAALTLTGHKIHGPVGIGALIVRPDFAVEPMIVGGGQQLGIRAGTEPVVPAVGLATALQQILGSCLSGEFTRVQALRDQFESELKLHCNATVVAETARRLPHTSNLSFQGIDRQALHMALDLKGVACSTGSACSSGSGRPSGSLVAMNLDDDTVLGSLRFSFSKFTTEDEITAGSGTIIEAVKKLQAVPTTQVPSS
ncbi:MAG: cysteine desulfurase family protein [Pirellulaceae bacterium]